MHPFHLAVLLAASVSAAVLPSGTEAGALTANPANVLVKRDGEIDCSGSGRCKSEPNLLRECDNAVNNLYRVEDSGFYYMYQGSSMDIGRLDGNCRMMQYESSLGLIDNGCKVWLEGPEDCKGTGDDLWHGYQQIRGGRPEEGEPGCEICGSKSFTSPAGSACKLKIDYVESCEQEYVDIRHI